MQKPSERARGAIRTTARHKATVAPVRKEPAAETKQKTWAAFTEKFGETTRDAGVACIPRTLLVGMARLDLTPMEAIVLMLLVAHWGKNGDPRPKRKTMLEWIGCDKRTLDRAIAGLVRKKLVSKRRRARRPGLQASNVYNLSGLVSQLAVISHQLLKKKKEDNARVQSALKPNNDQR